jgi:hypothetical protein
MNTVTGSIASVPEKPQELTQLAGSERVGLFHNQQVHVREWKKFTAPITTHGQKGCGIPMSRRNRRLPGV